MVIVGAGIVGLGTAWSIRQRHPDLSMLVLERGGGVGREQSGRNSGVIHSGIYYRPGSLKAETCRRGKHLLEEFCAAHDVPIRRCGKLIVATSDREMAGVERLMRRAMANGVEAREVDAARIAEIEPHARSVGGIHVPEAGVVDFGRVCSALAGQLAKNGGKIALHAAAVRAREEDGHVVVETSKGSVGASYLIACAGLESDRFARASGLRPGVRIVPFRGRYFALRKEASHLCNALIYPVPDPRFPFLGAHFTRRIDGTVEIGPTAAPAIARGTDPNRTRDALRTLFYPGLWALGLRHPLVGVGELWRTISRDAFFDAPHRLVPELTRADLVPAPSGLRAQALLPDGRLLDDFSIVASRRMIHVCNAPSPAATACLAIGDRIADLLDERLSRRTGGVHAGADGYT